MRGCWVGASSGRGRCPGPTWRERAVLSYIELRDWEAMEQGQGWPRPGVPTAPVLCPQCGGGGSPGSHGQPRRGSGGCGEGVARAADRGGPEDVGSISAPRIQKRAPFFARRERAPHTEPGNRDDERIWASLRSPQSPGPAGGGRAAARPRPARAEPPPPPLALPGTGHLLDSLPDGVDAVSVRGLWAVPTPSLAAWA